MAIRTWRLRLGAFLLVGGAVLGLDYGTRQVYRYFRNLPDAGPERAAEKRPTAKPPHRTWHPVFHHGLVPKSMGTDVFGPTRTTYFVNSAGCRDGSMRTVDIASRQPRVLLLGDSFAEGVGVPWEDTLAGRIGASLESQGVALLNGAVASYCPSLMQARLRYLLEEEKLRVDLVVAFLDISDVEDELNYEVQPGGGFHLKTTSRFAEARHWTWEKKLSDWLESRVENNFTLLGALSRNVRQTLAEVGGQGVSWELKRANWPEYHGPAEELVAEGLDRARKSMDGILGLVRGQQAKLLVVIYPWLEQVDAGIRPSRAEAVWEDWCRERQVPLVNLFPVFVPMGKNYEKKYCLAGDGHWNSAGHARVAAELLPQIELLLSQPKPSG